MITEKSESASGNGSLRPEFDFRAAMAATGLDFPGDVIPDGQLHRIKVNGDHNPNAWYVLHLDGLPAGMFGDWKRGIAETWCAKAGDVLTEAERAERDRKWKQQQAEREADRRRMHDEARAQAQAILDAARPATDDHPYLRRKGVQAHPGVMVGHWPQRQRDNCLLIPLRTAGGQLATVQAIFPDKPSDGRDKDFLKGGSTKGAHFALGDLAAAPVVVIAEGYATAATIHEATGHAAVMAVDAGNLKPVAEAICAAFPGKRIVIAADNDRHTEGNPGIAKATAAAQAVKADLAVPEFAEGEAGTDFNDLAQRRGADAVRRAIEQARPGDIPRTGDDLDAEFIPIGQFIASPPNSSYLVKGVLPASGIGQVFGNSHAGKSFVLIDLACHLALGWDWHGYKVKKTAVLYIAAEGVAGLKLRFRAWFQDHGVDPPPNLRIRTIPANLTAEGATAALRERMNRLPDPPGAVFVDTLATNFGSGSENDAEDMNAAIAGLKVLMESGLLLSAHHTGHGDKTRSRGHSSLFAALDVELHVTQDADKIIRVGHTKLRDGDKLDAIVAFNLKKVSLPWADVDGDPLNSAVLVKAEHVPQCSANAERLPASQRVALDALKTALIEHGVEEKGVVSVTEEQWRQAAYSAGISGGDTDRAKRQAFQRARLDLAAKKRISIVDGRVWIPDPRGTNRNKPEHVPQCSAGESGDGEERNGTSSFKRCSAVPPQCSPTPEPNVIDSPLARRILEALDGCPGGIARDDLARLVCNGKGSSPAMIDAEINALLLKRRIATVNGRLVEEVSP